MRAQSFLKEKENEREKWDKSFLQIRETILSAFIKYLLQKIVTRNRFVHKRKSYTVMPCSR